jgi:hypothetical protein
MRRLVTLLLSSAGVIACLLAPAVGAKQKPGAARAFSVSICVGEKECAPLKALTDKAGVVVSLRTAVTDPAKASGDQFPAPMKDAGWVSAQTIGISCPPTCSTSRPLAGKDVRLVAKEAPDHGYGSYDFGFWKGATCKEGKSSHTCTIHVSGNPNVQAIFYTH